MKIAFGVALLAFVSILAGAIVPHPLPAQDWPQWRGPNRDGVATGFTAPKVWPEQLKSKWKVNVGIGYSSPVVVGRQVFQLSRQNEKEVVSSFDLDTGKLLWQDSYPASFDLNPAATRHGLGPKSTPVVSGGKLYTLGIGGILSCYESATGKLRWRKNSAEQFGQGAPLYGAAMSPVLDRGLLIAHLGGHDKGALTALDAETGAVKWSWTGDGPGYASPIVVELGGVRQVVTQSQENIIGIAAATGALLWKMPFSVEYVQNIVTPVLYKDLLILSGYAKGMFALRVSRQGDAWKAEQAWQNTDVSLYMNSPVLNGGLLIGMSHRNRGQFFCLDAATGKTVWKGEGRQADNAAIVSAGDATLILTDNGEMIVARASEKGLEPIHRYRVADSPTWAHPALVGNRILVKDATSLSLFSLE